MNHMREWSNTGNNILSNDGILFDIPLVNPTTGICQFEDPREMYKLARLVAMQLNKYEIKKAYGIE